MAADHGTRSRYNAGCKCELCANAERQYKRDRRAKKREQAGTSAPAASVIAQLPAAAAPATESGETVEQSVQREIDKRDTSARPGLVATALALARVLDNRGALMQHASAAARLTDILNQIAGMATKTPSKVSALRSEYTGS